LVTKKEVALFRQPLKTSVAELFSEKSYAMKSIFVPLLDKDFFILFLPLRIPLWNAPEKLSK
jgi:hypothetical protein